MLSTTLRTPGMTHGSGVSASDWAAGTSLSVFITSSHLLQEQQGARIAAGVLFDTEPNARAACDPAETATLLYVCRA